MKLSKLASILILACGLRAEDGKLTIYMGGKQVATENYSIQKSEGKLKVSGSGKALLGSMKVTIDRFDLIEDDKFQPQSIDAKATLGQIQMAHLVTFSDGLAKDEINMGKSVKTKEDPIHADTLVVNSNLPLFAWSVLALRAKVDSTEPQTFYSYVLGQGENPVAVQSKGTENVEFAGKKADLSHLVVTFKPSASGDPVTADLWLDDARRIIKLVVTAQSVEAYQDGFEPKPSPEPAPEKPPQ